MVKVAIEEKSGLRDLAVDIWKQNWLEDVIRYCFSLFH